MKKRYFYSALSVLFLALSLSPAAARLKLRPEIYRAESGQAAPALWDYQCLDTMKYSRDTARSWAGRQDSLEALIDSQLSAAAGLGANCVALGTPYDREFVPFLRKWSEAARKKGLRVWFRGNFSGWEGWYGYPKLGGPLEHHQKTFAFILENASLFMEGDIFTPAPEAENGILGNPFASAENRKSLLDFFSGSFENCRQAFRRIGKNVRCGYFSTNGTVAKEILTAESVEKMGGRVVVDHYVKGAGQMSADLEHLSGFFPGPLVVGEFGAPIPDINGPMDEAGQAAFIGRLLEVFYGFGQSIEGVNYWTLAGGTTALFREDGSAKPAAGELERFFRPAVVRGRVLDGLGRGLEGARVRIFGSRRWAGSDSEGRFSLPVPAGRARLLFEKEGYAEAAREIVFTGGQPYQAEAELLPENPGPFFGLKRLLYFSWPGLGRHF